MAEEKSASTTPGLVITSWADETEKELQEDTHEVVDKLAGATVVSEAKDEEDPLPTQLDRDDANAKVVIEQDDPNSPLYSASSFEELGLRPELLQGVYAMKFSKPSKIQEAALPIILANPPKNLIAQAQSGTGKTAAFTLGILSRVDSARNFAQAILVSPTRELARQNFAVLRQMAKFCTDINILLVVRDATLPQEKQLPHQIICGTPGKILGLIKQRRINTRNIKILVLDEADVMIDTQNLGDMGRRIKQACPKSTQVLLFSATYEEKVKSYALKFVPNPRVSIYLQKDELRVDKIKQFFIDCGSEENKFSILSDLYAYMTIGQSIIFVHTRKTAQMLCQRMQAEGHTISLLHGGDMSAEERDSVIDAFRSGKSKVLITTNVLARGIDILQVSLVINYDLPMHADNTPDPQTYLHRIGRTGRWQQEGIAINLVHDEKSKRDLQAFVRYFGKPIHPIPVDKLDQLDDLLKHCVT